MSVNEKTKTLLLVDDEKDALQSLATALAKAELKSNILTASTSEQAIQKAGAQSPDVAIIDLCLNEIEGVESGFDLLKLLIRKHPSCRVIVLTGHGAIEYGVRAISMGAASFLEKPAEILHLSALIKDGFRQSELRKALTELQQENQSGIHGLITGRSQATEKLKEEIYYASQTSQPVLITGETGTGKGLCAQTVHQLGKRKNFSFVRYQPTFSSPDLVGSELFGHKKGAFTGAQEDRAGLISEAHQGSLFLDEIDSLPLSVQVMLLGTLQDKTYRSLGTSEELKSDFRLICATNNDLKKCIEEEKLRSDFYHRIAHLEIKVPALRDRKDDIPPLTEHFLKKLQSQEQLNVFHISGSAVQTLKNFNWPGNIRELAAKIEHAAFKAQFKNRTEILPEDLPLTDIPDQRNDQSFRTQVEEYKLKLIKEALARCDDNQSEAARLLKLDRSSMLRILGRS